MISFFHSFLSTAWNIMRYGSNTSSSCRIILVCPCGARRMLFLILGGISRIFETAKYVQTHGKRGMNVIQLVLYSNWQGKGLWGKGGWKPLILIRKMPLILFCEGRSSFGRPRRASCGVVLLKWISKGNGLGRGRYGTVAGSCVHGSNS